VGICSLLPPPPTASAATPPSANLLLYVQVLAGKAECVRLLSCCCATANCILAAVLRLQVPLSARGWEQAVACGDDIRTLMESEHGSSYKLFFMTSPYCRTRQTFVGVRQAFPDENFAGVQVGS
jgi:hypothetical protein